MNNARILSLVFAAAFLAPCLLHAQTLELSEVPVSLPAAQRDALVIRRTEILRRWDDFLAEKSAFVRDFQGTQEGTERATEAAKRKVELKAEADSIVDAADNFNGHDLTAAIDTELEVVNHRIAQTRSELQKLTPQLLGFQASVDEWTNLAEHARDEARKTARETVATLLLEKLAMKNETEIKLDEGALKRIDVLLRKRVFMDDLYAQVVTVEKLSALKTDADVIMLLKSVQATLVLQNARESKDPEEVGKGVLKVIEVVNQDPGISLLIADGEMTIDAAYGWLAHKYAGDRINQLLSLGEGQFTAVKALTTLYKRDIDSRKTLLAARQ